VLAACKLYVAWRAPLLVYGAALGCVDDDHAQVGENEAAVLTRHLLNPRGGAVEGREHCHAPAHARQDDQLTNEGACGGAVVVGTLGMQEG
jgi:hypothetical protein